MVKSETRRDAETLVQNPRPRQNMREFETEINALQTRLLRLFAKAVEISRSDEKFTRPKILEVPFATPLFVITIDNLR